MARLWLIVASLKSRLQQVEPCSTSRQLDSGTTASQRASKIHHLISGRFPNELTLVCHQRLPTSARSSRNHVTSSFAFATLAMKAGWCLVKQIPLLVLPVSTPFRLL